MKLAAKLILVFLVGVLGIVSLFAWQTIRRQRDWEAQRRVNHAGDIAETLAPTIEQAYKEGGTITIQKAIEVSTQKLRGPEVRWVNGESSPTLETQTISRQTSSLSITDADGNRKAYFYFPMTLGQDQPGAVEVAEPLSDQDAFTRKSITDSLWSLMGVAALSGLVIYMGGVRLVGKPLQRLIAQVVAIGNGQVNLPPVIESSDELGRLALAISEMSHRIGQQRDTIRHTDRLGTIGTLAAGMAHELGTPLNVVSGRAGLIKSGKLTPQEVIASAETIQTEADRMTKIIRQLLDFARQKPAPHESIDLVEVTKRTCDLMRSLARNANVELRTDFGHQPLTIDGDASQIQQVITNLINNAIAAMPTGGTVMVTLASETSRAVRPRRDATMALQECSRPSAKIEVKDTGVGIAAESVARIFEPFYTTKDVGEGTGLGLSIAYGIVREHDGDIQVTSEPGHGSTFTVTLPAHL